MIISSLILTTVYLVYYIFIVYSNKQVDSMIVKVTSMSVGMISNLLIGMIFGIVIQGRLAATTIAAIIVSILIGYVITKPYGLLVILEAIVSGIMGSAMGAMLGTMLQQNEVNLMLLFLDVLFVLSMAIVVMIIKTAKEEKNSIGKKQSYMLVSSIVIPIAIIGTVNFISSYIDQYSNHDSMQHYNHKMNDNK